MDPSSLPDPGAVPADVRTEPVPTDNSARPEDGPQDVSQDPSLDYSVLDLDDDGVEDVADDVDVVDGV